MKISYTALFLILAFVSCKKSQHDIAFSILQKWDKKEILFPANSVFTIQGKDTVAHQLLDRYKILIYTDSLGCMSCKSYLPEWRMFIKETDSLFQDSLQFLFIFSSKRKQEVRQVLLRERFKYPICIDEQDSINILNSFPSDIKYQTFLLDRDNKVIAIGNPIYNPKIKELYLNIISGKKPSISKKELQTNIEFDITLVDLDTFNWKQEQVMDVVLTNTGNELLVIEGISTSCGCTTVKYSKEPVQPGKNLALKVKYKADHPEHFNKTIMVYCNAKGSPFKLQVSGNAE